MSSPLAAALVVAALAGASAPPVAPKLLVTQRPASAPVEVSPTSKVQLDADLLEYDGQGHRVLARGNVVLRAAGAVVRANQMVYEEEAARITASGDTLAVFGAYAAVAQQVQATLRQGELSEAILTDALLMQKEGISPEELLAARTREGLRHLGRTVVALTGTRLVRLGPNEFRVEDLSFTPCDCDPDQPSWRIQARGGDVIPGERAILRWPVVYVGAVPVLALPWLYLPLTDRRTGLLIPRPDWNPGLNGFSLEQPVFVTLGQSHDLTFTPAWYSGGALPPPGGEWHGVQGPRLLTEFRYAPSARTGGRVLLDLLNDSRPVRHPFDPTATEQRSRGLRGQFVAQHAQELGHDLFTRVDAALLSDGYYWRDLNADVLARETDYLRSSASAYHRGVSHHEALALAFRQDITARPDLSVGSKVVGPDHFGGDRIWGPSTLQELPSASFSFPTAPLFGALHGGLSVQLTRHAPLDSPTGDEGTLANEGRARDSANLPLSTACVRQRLFSYRPDPNQCPAGTPFLEEGQGDRIFQSGEREPRDRLDVMPRLAIPFAAGPIDGLPYVAWRQTAYAGEVTGRTAHRGYPVGGLSVQTELARALSPTLAHALSPRLELRTVPAVLQSSEPAPYDAVDEAIPAGGYLLQGVAELRNRLVARDPSSTHEVARLDLAQGFESRAMGSPAVLRDTSARLGIWQGPLSLHLLGRYDAPRRKLTQLNASAQLVAAGVSLSAAFSHLAIAGTDQTHRGIDALLGAPEPQVADPGDAQQLSAALGYRFGFGLALRYSLILTPRVEEPLPAGGVRSGPLVNQQRLDLSYSPACDCWQLDLYAVQRPGGLSDPFPVPQVGFNLTLARFGSFGRGG